jgi:hypothetical protein
VTLSIVDGFVELDGERVAKLLPVRPTLLYWLTEAFDALDEAAAYIEELEERLAARPSRTKAAFPGPGTALKTVEPPPIGNDP